MPTSRRALGMALVSTLMCSLASCRTVPPETIRQSQLRAWQLHQQNKSLAAESAQARQMADQLTAEKLHLEQQRAQLESELDVANRRLNNLNAERSQMRQRYVSLLQNVRDQPSPLSEEATKRFVDLAQKYPNFEFDPQTGVSKFREDILFGSGSDKLKSEADPLLHEFAKIMNGSDVDHLNVLVVGHTDDRPISKSTTRVEHPTNWHLSTDRANSVVLALQKHGLSEHRMGAAGYSMHQPLVPNADDKSRQKNRRVEIFVLTPDAVVASWNPAH